MCYAGERSLSTIGRLRAKGGIHYVKGLFHNYVALENTHQYNTDVPESFMDNSQPVHKYSDFVLKLCGTTELLKLNVFEMNSLYDSVSHFLEVEVNEPVIVKSDFMRLRRVYFNNKSDNPMWKTRDFYSWTMELYQRYLSAKKSLNKTDFCDLVVSFTPSSNTELVVTGMIDEFTNAGVLLTSDFEGIVKDLATFQPQITKKAIIKGLAFTGRGKHAREAMEPFLHNTTVSGRAVTHRYSTNAMNNLSSNWWKSDDYSSWCMIKHYKTRPNKTIATTTEMGQANFFFRLNFPSDKCLHGLAFANMAIRNSTYDRLKRHHYITPNSNSFNGERQFVCLNYVCSTKLAVSVLDVNNLPIVKQRKFGSARWMNDLKIIQVSPEHTMVNKMYFIEMHPERVDYVYQPTEEDLDGTRNWEI
jgi:hypothetical protein